MRSPAKYYLRHMFNKTKYRATWDPSRNLKIGDVGRLDASGFFTVFSNLEKEGIKPELAVSQSEASLDYTSSDKVTVDFNAGASAPIAGAALTDASAKFDVKFSSDEAIVFKIDGFTTEEIINLKEVEAHVVKKYKEKNWDKDYLIITHLITAKASTIIISNSNSASLEIQAKAAAGAANIKITDANAGLTITKTSGSTLNYLAQNNSTPLFRAMGIRHPLIGRTSIEVKAAVEGEEEDLGAFQLQDFDEREVEQEVAIE